jgi:hypothetical protein
MDLDPAIFVIDLQDANKKQIFNNKFFCLSLFEGTFAFEAGDQSGSGSNPDPGLQ